VKILHILKTRPDEAMRELFEEISRNSVVSVVELYDPNIDWQSLVNDILNHDQVIYWE
jgi:hypothetical protein